VRRSARVTDAVQRVIDIVVAGGALAAGAPLIAGAAVAVGAGQPFTLIKFRTMRDVDERRGLVTDAQRLTGLGRALRAWSLDELPTLWNVLRGDMSLVGPRPLLMQYLDVYTPEQARRHLVRPGITGLSQVSGRNGQTWEERLAMDVWYVDHRSLTLNARILLRTLLTLLRRDGISAPGESTMPLFTGSPRARAEAGGDD
jgi:lipopolysaccharide/colanic/teichoic acid biosynthesis glycosyltransferase